MRINFTLFGAGLTGGSFNIIEPADRLARRGHDVSITSIGKPRDLNWFSMRGDPLFREIFTPLVGNFWYKTYRRVLKGTFLHPFPDVEIRDLIRSMPDCDVNIATAWPTTFAVHRSGKGRGFYYVQHYDSLFIPKPQALLHDETYYLPLKKIAVSSWIKNTVEEKLGTPFAGVITAGIDEKTFQPDSSLRPKNKIRILSLGRRIDWKGFLELQSAMKNILAKYKNVEWTVFSSRDTPKPTKDIPFTLIKSPYGKDLARLYASAHIVVNPSWHEGFAQPALEAMSCGAAVVTTPVGAEDFMEDGENSLVVQPKDSKGIESAIAELIDDSALRDRISERGYEKSKNFHWDKIIDKWEKILTQN